LTKKKRCVHIYEKVVNRYDYQFKEEALPLELGRSSGLSSLMSRNTGGIVWVPEDALKKPCTEVW
jgi:hypothetical protein